MAVSDLSPAFLIAQAIGPVTTVMAVVSAQMKKLVPILIFEILANGLCALSYILLGGISGSYICLIAIAQSIISILYAHNNKKVPNWITGIFIMVYVAVSAYTYATPMDILPGICAVTFALAIAQSKPSGYRLCMAINTALWIVYDLLVGAYTMIITHGLLLGSLIIAMVRYAKKPKEVATENGNSL